MATPLPEPLVLRSMGNKGYLKLPRAFTKLFSNFNAKSLPDPLAYLEVEDGKVRLTYEWQEKELG